jgi:large subunit ribosomal protein L9
LAIIATEGEIKKLEEKKEKERLRAEKDLEKNQETAKKLEDYELEIAAKVDKEGNLYAAVGAAQIAKALKEKGFNVKKDQIKIDESIKELGEKEIIVEFPHNLEAKIRVIIVEEK